MMNTNSKVLSINSLTPEERNDLFSEMIDVSLDKISRETEKEKKDGMKGKVRELVKGNGNNLGKNPFNPSQR